MQDNISINLFILKSLFIAVVLVSKLVIIFCTNNKMINFLIRHLRMSTLLTHTFVNKSLISSNMNSLFLGSGVEDRGLEKWCFTRTLFPFRTCQYMSSASSAGLCIADQQAAKVLVTMDTISQVFWAKAR